jgi:hypothetical protein
MLHTVSRGCWTPSQWGRGLLAFFAVRRAWRTAKIVNRVFFEKAHGKGTLPCKKLLCTSIFAVRFLAFAVRPRRTAKL